MSDWLNGALIGVLCAMSTGVAGFWFGYVASRRAATPKPDDGALVGLEICDGTTKLRCELRRSEAWRAGQALCRFATEDARQ